MFSYKYHPCALVWPNSQEPIHPELWSLLKCNRKSGILNSYQKENKYKRWTKKFGCPWILNNCTTIHIPHRVFDALRIKLRYDAAISFFHKTAPNHIYWEIHAYNLITIAGRYYKKDPLLRKSHWPWGKTVKPGETLNGKDKLREFYFGYCSNLSRQTRATEICGCLKLMQTPKVLTDLQTLDRILWGDLRCEKKFNQIIRMKQTDTCWNYHARWFL